ncbi:MAG: TerB family tellurite resistance protein [Armatimonadetes bacterium]|nr:TerB family tellurite resistance protein [Armatimonadota bacterium]
MGRITFDSIEPNLVDVEEKEGLLHFSFRCPATGIEVDSVVTAAGESCGAAERQGLEQGLLGVLETMLGPPQPAPTAQAIQLTAAEFRKIAVQAFEAVESSFFWDGRRWIWWEANDAVREFVEQCTSYPVQSAEDRDVLGRMLVEVAAADRRLTPQELVFLREFFPDVLTPEGRLRRVSPLAAEELAGVKSRRVRQTMWMLAYALALCDEELAPEEESILDDFADAFRLPGLRSWELKRYAQYFVVDQAVARAYRKGEATPEERDVIMRLALKLGLGLEEAQNIEIRYRARVGLD